MKAEYGNAVSEALEDAPAAVRKAFFKQVGLLVQDLHHPSLHAKKYDKSNDRWQAPNPPTKSCGTQGCRPRGTRKAPAAALARPRPALQRGDGSVTTPGARGNIRSRVAGVTAEELMKLLGRCAMEAAHVAW